MAICEVCGREHSCAIQHVVIREGAVNELGSLAGPYRHIVVAADRNTFAVGGEAVLQQLGDRVQNTLVYPDEGFLVPNEYAIERLQAVTDEQTDLIVGIGSGVIQDLCKYVSFLKGLPYFIVATAPSMDGYASVGAALILGNMKITKNAHVPQAIIGDVDFLKTAPLDMIRAGYGDILGKFSCLNDWKLSRVANGEYFCQKIYDMIYDMLMKTRDLGPALQERQPEAIQTLMEALVGVGIAMAYVGNSRPASGSEHHLSHFFEIVGILNNEPYFLHGIDVACSAVITQRLRERLLEMEPPFAPKAFDEAAYEQEIHRIYGAAADGVFALQKKLGWRWEDRTALYAEKWDEIRDVLREVPSSGQLQAYLESAGLSMEAFAAQYGEEKLRTAVNYAMDLKDRYTVLWLYNALEA